jgi:hypothetical protein
MITVSHPTVNQYVRTLVTALSRAGKLESFHTTLAFGRRKMDIPTSEVRQHPFPEAVRLICERLRWQPPIRQEGGWASVDAVARELDRIVARTLNRTEAVYCYEDSALETFRTAREAGIRRYYELPILYWETGKRLLDEEAERYPDWERTLEGNRDSPEKQRRKTEELRLADLVICPSRNVQQSLPAGTSSIVALYGCPEPEGGPKRKTGNKLRILFAGALSQRKGLADIFAAMRQLRRTDVELVLFGTLKAELEFYRTECSSFVYEPPRPNRELRQLMFSCDALALPSIVEGRAMVQLEALSCGLPIIVTPNAGAEDLVEPGVTGFLVPVRSPEKIAEAIDWIADHRQWLDDVRPAILNKAKQCSWEGYTEKILAAISRVGRNEL